MKILSANIVSILFIVLAAYFVHEKQEGWGWCIFAAVICTASVEFGGNKGEVEEDE